MLLAIIFLILLLVFLGVGFSFHLLWILALLALIVLIILLATGRVF